MISGLILLLLQPLAVLASPQPCGTTIACPHPIAIQGKTGEAAELVLLSAMQKAIDAHNSYHAAIAAEEKIRAELSSSLEDWRKQEFEDKVKAVAGREKEMNDRFKELSDMMLEAYGTKPIKTSGQVKGGPAKGLTPTWAPKIVPKSIDGKKLVYTAEINPGDVDGDGNDDKSWVSVDFLHGNANGASGTTLANGDVLIPITAVADALRTKNPAWLASTYYHESVHFSELIGKGWTTYEQGEVDADDTVSRYTAEFGLNEVQRGNIAARAATNQARLDAGRHRSAFPMDSEQKTSMDLHFDVQAERQAIQDAQYELRMNLFRQRTTREQELRDAEEERRRQRNVARDDEAWAEQVQAMVIEARNCFLVPEDTSKSLFQVRGWGGHRVRLSAAPEDGDAARVALMFLGACLGAESRPACTQAMPKFEVLRRRSDFRDIILKSMTTYGVLQQCVDRLVAESKPNHDYGRLRNIAVTAWAELARPVDPTAPPPHGGGTPRRPRDPEPETRPEIPHCRRSGPWCDGTQDPR